MIEPNPFKVQATTACFQHLLAFNTCSGYLSAVETSSNAEGISAKEPRVFKVSVMVMLSQYAVFDQSIGDGDFGSHGYQTWPCARANIMCARAILGSTMAASMRTHQTRPLTLQHS